MSRIKIDPQGCLFCLGLFWFVITGEVSAADKAAPTVPASGEAPVSAEAPEITLDFNNVDLPIFVKFISELTGKNFIIDDRVKGKVTIFSPEKIPVSRAYDIFVSVLELKGFAISTRGDIHQIVPATELPPERAIHVYTLENAAAEEIAKVLTGLVPKTAGPPRKSKPTGELTAAIQILSDKTTNALIITATEEDYEVLKGLIKKLDLKRRQVYVEAVVLEMAADKFRELGTELGAILGYGDNANVALVGGVNQNPADLTGLADLATRLNIAVRPLNVRAFLRALQTSSDVNVLSTPQILTTDNQKAEIVVAQNVPFPGAQSQTVGGNVQTTIERKDVGIILRLTPNVLENNVVKLEVYQEISSVLDTATTAGVVSLGPTTNKRSAATTVIVSDAQTVVIGGLIRDNVILTQRKVPLLGNIPYLGWLFKSTTRRVEKTNLLIFLTPHIVHNANDLEAISADKTQRAIHFMEEEQVEGLKTRQEMFKDMTNPPQ